MAACEMGSVNLTGAVWLAEAVANLHGAYAQIHPYVAVALCLAGTAMNIVTVIVLTRPSMQSPINWLLCAVALCDILVMSSVLIFVCHFLIAAASRCDVSDWNRGWAYFLFVHAQTTVIFHATSIWLTVLLAQIRVYTIKQATSGPAEAVTPRSTFYIAVTTLALVIVANVPNFLTFEIVERLADGFCGDEDQDTPASEPVYLYQVIASEQDCGLLKAAFWTNGILFKVVPCFMLTLSMATLVRIIREVSHRRKTLAQVMNKRRMPRDHTTPMLVAVISIFLIAELPQGILHVCNAIFSKETFYIQIYQPLGDFMDLLSLLNSAVNFIIYCAMSRKFRCVFLQLTLSCLPNHIYRKFIQDWSDLNENEFSRRKPSGYTTELTTKTEQLALTSHRVSATSMLIGPPSRELNNVKVYTGNLLSVEPAGSCYLTTPRVSMSSKQPFEARSSLEIHEMKIAVPQIKPQQRRRNVLETLRDWMEQAFTSTPSTPQRRIQMLNCETSTAGY